MKKTLQGYAWKDWQHFFKYENGAVIDFPDVFKTWGAIARDFHYYLDDEGVKRFRKESKKDVVKVKITIEESE